MIKRLPFSFYLLIIIAVILSFSFVHTLLLISIMFFTNHKADSNSAKPPIYADYLPLLMPILWFTPSSDLLILLIFVISLIFWLLDYIPRKLQYLLIFISLALFVYGSLVSTQIVTDFTNLDLEKLWWGKPDLLTQTQLMRDEALYLPYPLRSIVFSPFLVYSYQILKSSAGLLSPFQLTTFTSFIILYLILIGLYHHLRRPSRNDLISITFFTFALFIAGINRSPDKLGTFYPLLPFLLYYLRLGVSHASRRTVFALTAVSILILPGLFL
jgi:hypothetical protein